MAVAPASEKWLRGRVKAVPSGDTLVIASVNNPNMEKTLTLSSLIAPRLARKGGVDEPFAWESREYLRKLCIGKEVTFRVEYTVQQIQREFGSVFLEGDRNKNVAMLVVSQGWAKVRELGQAAQQKIEASPFLPELQRLEEQAKLQGLGKWTKVPGASEASIRDLPPSAIGDSSGFDPEKFCQKNKGRSLEAIVEQVRDGSSVRVYLLPEFHFVQVILTGIQCPSMGRRASGPTPTVEGESSPAQPNGEAAAELRAPLTSAQRLAAPAATDMMEVAPDPFGREAKHFTETRVLHRDVRVILEGYDRNNLVGSVYYDDGTEAKNLGLELLKNGLAKYMEWSAKLLEEKAKWEYKAVELEAKKNRIKMWTNFVPPASNSKAIHNQNFTGKVVEVVSGDCIIVADDAVPFGSPLAERRVNLSSIRCPRMRVPPKDMKPQAKDAKPQAKDAKPQEKDAKPQENDAKPQEKDTKEFYYAREAKEFLRQRLIGRQVNVSMEYSRKVGDGPNSNAADSRIMDFGSVFLLDNNATSVPSTAGDQPAGYNVAEMVLSRGLGNVVRHRDFEERSNHYDALLTAESRATANKKGIHSTKEPPAQHIQDLTNAPPKKARDFLMFLQRNRRLHAIVEYVHSGHRFKLLIPKETCSINFSFSGVRCPGRNEPFSDEAIALMRRKILQRDVEIEVETVDRGGTFLGSLWESKTNMAAVLLEAGLAKFQAPFGADRIADSHLLAQAEASAKRKKLKIWENYVEGQEVATNGSSSVPETRKKEVLKVAVTEVLGGGKFYVQTVGDQMVASVQQQLASLEIGDSPLMGTFNPKKGDLVLAQFSADNSWNRAMIVNVPRGGTVQSVEDKFEVFYIDYGNQEIVSYKQLRALPPSMISVPGLAQLCSLAFLKVPSLEEDYGLESAEHLSGLILNGKEFSAMIEERDTSGGKVKGQGTGTVLLVTLVDVEAGSSINASMLQAGLAVLEKRRRWDTKERKAAIDNLEEFQQEAKTKRSGMWEYGDIIGSDDEDSAPPTRKAPGGRR